MTKEISPRTNYVDTYEAFDTIREDTLDTLLERDARIAEVTDLDEINEIKYNAVEKGKLIRERLQHVLGATVSGITSPAGMREDSLTYVAQYETEKERAAASARVDSYNGIINLAASGEVISDLYIVDMKRRIAKKTFHKMTLHGERIEGTNKVWVNPLDPRGVEFSGFDSPGRTIDTFDVVEHTVDPETNTHTVVTGPTEEHGLKRTITFDDTSDIYRMSTRGNGEETLVKSIPADRASLFELENAVSIVQRAHDIMRMNNNDNQTEATIKSNMAARKVAEHATGFNRPNIITTFEHPDNANPIPVSVAKRD